MRIIRYVKDGSVPVLAVLTDSGVVHPLPQQGFMDVIGQAKQQNVTTLEFVKDQISHTEPIDESVEELQLLTPIDAPEVWACGVTYERSRDARNYEVTAGALDSTTFYDKVYDAERPEIFFKSTAKRTVGTEQEIHIRSDSNWQVPEPELGLILDREGTILGYTIGNDMSCRDIEGDNPLYLPQAKIWKNSCSIGPAILLAEAVADPYKFSIACRIYRSGELVVDGKTSTGNLKRKFDELVSFLLRDNEVFDGTVLLTGTGIVPPNEFTLLHRDLVEIEIPGIGVLRNQVSLPRQFVYQ